MLTCNKYNSTEKILVKSFTLLTKNALELIMICGVTSVIALGDTQGLVSLATSTLQHKCGLGYTE